MRKDDMEGRWLEGERVQSRGGKNERNKGEEWGRIAQEGFRWGEKRKMRMIKGEVGRKSVGGSRALIQKTPKSGSFSRKQRRHVIGSAERCRKLISWSWNHHGQHTPHHRFLFIKHCDLSGSGFLEFRQCLLPAGANPSPASWSWICLIHTNELWLRCPIKILIFS